MRTQNTSSWFGPRQAQCPRSLIHPTVNAGWLPSARSGGGWQEAAARGHCWWTCFAPQCPRSASAAARAYIPGACPSRTASARKRTCGSASCARSTARTRSSRRTAPSGRPPARCSPAPARRSCPPAALSPPAPPAAPSASRRSPSPCRPPRAAPPSACPPSPPAPGSSAALRPPAAVWRLPVGRPVPAVCCAAPKSPGAHSLSRRRSPRSPRSAPPRRWRRAPVAGETPPSRPSTGSRRRPCLAQPHPLARPRPFSCGPAWTPTSCTAAALASRWTACRALRAPPADPRT
mmetsp:Transcript_65562/g.109225  ORF Transcript_65562/g.109225 Transcript_65562/m.109225 type:complete len:291 (-) Transcript_65562:801-1673(-)